MRVRAGVTALTFAAVLAACGGAGSPTQAPGGGQATAGSGPTAIPATTQPGGGGGGGNTGGGSGQIHIDIDGPVKATVDQPFFAFGSRWSGDIAGVALNFTGENAAGVASIASVSDKWLVSWTSEEMSVSSQSCELSNWNVGATSGSGSFDCKDGVGVKVADGSYLTGVTMKGSFQASK
jgi:hypothetical protein